MKRVFVYVLSCFCAVTAMAQTDELVVKDLNIAPGGTSELAIELNNAAKQYSAFQFDLTLPTGISIAKDGENLKASLSSRASGHQLHVAEIKDGTYRFLAYSMENADITGTSGTLINVTLEAAADAAKGELAIASSEGLLVTADCEETTQAGGEDVATISILGSEKITIANTAGKLAYASAQPLDFSSKSDIKAYIATGYDYTKGTIYLSRVMKVPANTGIYLVADKGATDYDIPVAADGDVYLTNLLNYTMTGRTVKATEDGNANYYYSSNGDYGAGFYRAAEGGTTLGANRAWLSVPASVSAVGAAGSTEHFKINASGKQTYFSSNSLDFSSVEELGVKAYIATGYDYNKGTIYLSRVNQVPAQVGIYVMKKDGGEFDVPTASVAAVYANALVGNLPSVSITGDESIAGVNYVNYYYSSSGDFGAGFYKASNDGVVLPANRCYLHVPAKTSGARTRGIADDGIVFAEESEVISIPLLSGIGYDEDGTTRISTLENEDGDGFYYNLRGQRVENPGKGLYIKNGKKVVIK